MDGRSSTSKDIQLSRSGYDVGDYVRAEDKPLKLVIVPENQRRNTQGINNMQQQTEVISSKQLDGKLLQKRSQSQLATAHIAQTQEARIVGNPPRQDYTEASISSIERQKLQQDPIANMSSEDEEEDFDSDDSKTKIKRAGPCKNNRIMVDDDDEMESEDEYFESSSNEDNLPLQNNANSSFPDSSNHKLRQYFSPHQKSPQEGKKAQSSFQHNSDELHRTELGGVVVYDAFARIMGNSHLIDYYKKTQHHQTNFNLLFTPAEVAYAEKLFYKEPRERDFQNEFDKFLYKHLPKFVPQRDFNFSANNHSNNNNSFMTGQPTHAYTINVPQQENMLIFDSRFENANLRRAIKVNNVEYNLWLENDVNTKGHTQWFYFKVIHRYPKKQKIQFNILNLAKPQSLYSLGMKICVKSKKKHNGQWFHGGEDNVKYFQNQIPRKTATQQSQATQQNPSTQNMNGNHAANMFLYNNSNAGEGLEYYFTLSFIYEFDEDEDEVYFAQAVPYTFTDLQKDMVKMRDQTSGLNIMDVNILCKELAGTPCPMVTITENIDTYQNYYDTMQLHKELPNLLRKQLHKKYVKSKKLLKQSLESKGKVRKLLKAAFEEEINSFYENNADVFKTIDDTHNTVGDGALFGRRYDQFGLKMRAYISDHFHKKAIIITSRVHPGEPQSSHMLQGMLEFLISDEAADLRRNFVFRIIPMLNIDGVIFGNQRCSLLGVDLNRRWVSPNVFLHPTIFYAKHLVRHMHNERRVLMYCDLHGHSRKQNAFFYACTYKNYEHEGRIKNAQIRMMPLLCCHKAPNHFKFADCRFRIEKCKESTARVVIFREFNIMNAFTLESSFFGKEPDQPPEPQAPEENPDEEDDQAKILARKKYQAEMEAYLNRPKKSGTHFSVDDLKVIGKTLPQVLNNYLPREQSKLEILSSKILEIFYEEFIKFIPPYVLRREEERRKQMGGGSEPPVLLSDYQQQQPTIQATSFLVQNTLFSQIKSPTTANVDLNYFGNSSPRTLVKVPSQTNTRRQQVSSLQRQSIVDEEDSQSISNQPSMKKINNNKVAINISNNNNLTSLTNIASTNQKRQSNQSVPPSSISQLVGQIFIKKKKGAKNTNDSEKQPNTGTETDTFSQIIKIHQNQEDILDFEHFIKGEQIMLQQINEEENDGGAAAQGGNMSDSSADSDESAKNLLVQSTLQQQSHLASKLMAAKNAAKKKKPPQLKKEKKDEDELIKSVDVSKKKRQSLLSRGAQQYQGDFKFKSAQKSNQGNLKLISKTSIKPQNALDFQFDKIPHRQQSRSPLMKEPPEKSLELQEEISSADEKAIDQAEINEEEKVQQQVASHNFTFKTYDDPSYHPHLRQNILPLYENPLYHQNRLSSISGEKSYFHMPGPPHTQTQQQANNASILYNNMKNPFSQQLRQPTRGSNMYEPYSDEVIRHNNANRNNVRINTLVAAPQSNSVNSGSIVKKIGESQSAFNSLQRPSTQQQESLIAPKSSNQNPILQQYQRNLITRQLPDQSHQPILAQEISDIHNKIINLKKQRIQNYQLGQNNPLGKIAPPQQNNLIDEDIFNNRRQQQPQGENLSLQRISFKELLESSRQQRTSEKRNQKSALAGSSKVPGPLVISSTQTQGSANQGLMHMLKTTYQRIQHQQSHIGADEEQVKQTIDHRDLFNFANQQTPKKMPLTATEMIGYSTSKQPQHVQYINPGGGGSYQNTQRTNEKPYINSFHQVNQPDLIFPQPPNIMIVNKKQENTTSGIQHVKIPPQNISKTHHQNKSKVIPPANIIFIQQPVQTPSKRLQIAQEQMLDRSVVLMPENHRNYNDASKKHQTSLDIKRTVMKKPK